ncbi:MAG: STAS domain-containing protein [Clostridiales bacterium]
MSNEYNLKYEIKNDFIKIELSGEVDIYNTQKFKEEFYNIIDDNIIDIKIDCTNLDYIDSTGLGVLVGVLKIVKKNKKEIYIYNLKENIKKLFTITGLEKLFIIE